MSTQSLGTLTLDLVAKTGGFESGMDRAARVADRKTKEIERQAKARAEAVQEAFTQMAAGIAAAWGTLNLVGSVKGAIDLADQMGKLSQRTGAAVKELSALNYAASLNDATLSDLEQGLKGLSNKMFEAAAGSGESAAAFNALGISVTDSAGKLRPVEQVLMDIAERFKGMEDGAGKMAVANKLMEESGVKLIPTLNAGRQGLADMRKEAEAFGAVIGDDLARSSAEFNDHLTRLQTVGQGFSATIAKATVPALNELAKELSEASKQTGVWNLAAGVAKTTIETLAILGANVAFVFRGVGREIGGVAAQLNALARLDFKAFSSIGSFMKEDAKEARAALDEFERRIMNPPKPTATLPAVTVTAAPLLGDAAGAPKGTKTPRLGASKAFEDPLADAGKAYGAAMDMLAKAQIAADMSGQNLTATQLRLVEVMTDPTFAQMPETWRANVATQAEFALQAEKAAAEQARLNELIAATPTAQLEQQRSNMQFLADAMEQGRISAEQFSEAAATSLGNVPAAGDAAKESFLDLTLVANDAANKMAGAFSGFFSGQETSIKDMAASFLKATAEMILQAMALKAIKAGLGAMGVPGFADGAAFGTEEFAKGGTFGTAEKFAKGGAFTNKVFNQPTLFKFASGGSFRQGVLGEQGPESVMPLKRGKDGKLGVIASGAAGDTVVNITINESGQRSESGNGNPNATRELGRQIEGAVMAVLVREKRVGGMLA